MHVVVIRRDIYEANPWVAQSLMKAFLAAKKIAYQDLYETAALKTMLPWLTAHVDAGCDEPGATGSWSLLPACRLIDFREGTAFGKLRKNGGIMD